LLARLPAAGTAHCIGGIGCRYQTGYPPAAVACADPPLTFAAVVRT